MHSEEVTDNERESGVTVTEYQGACVQLVMYMDGGVRSESTDSEGAQRRSDVARRRTGKEDSVLLFGCKRRDLYFSDDQKYSVNVEVPGESPNVRKRCSIRILMRNNLQNYHLRRKAIS